MKDTIFVGARLKAQRAEHHLDEINSLFAAFVKSAFCKLHIEVDANTGDNLLKLESISNLPPEIALAVGDALHNLRTAMDHIAFDVLGATEDSISFPTGKTRNDLIATRQYKAIKTAMPDFADFIADVIKPYQGGDYQLWEIAALDNLDKHRLVIPVVSIQALTNVSAEDDNHNVFDECTFAVGEGGVLRAVRAAAKMKITDSGVPVANMFFGKGTTVEGRSVIASLAEFSRLTLEAIRALERFHFGNVVDPTGVK